MQRNISLLVNLSELTQPNHVFETKYLVYLNLVFALKKNIYLFNKSHFLNSTKDAFVWCLCMYAYRMTNGWFEVRIFLLFKRTMTTFYITPYNSWSLYYFKFKKCFLNFRTRLFISITSFWHKFLAYHRQYYRSLNPLLLNKLYYLSILNSKSHL